MEDNTPLPLSAKQSPRQTRSRGIESPRPHYEEPVSEKVHLEKLETIFERDLKPISGGLKENIQNDPISSPRPTSNFAAGDALLKTESDDDIEDYPEYPEGVEGIQRAKSDIDDIIHFLHEKNELVDIGFPIKLPRLAPEKLKLPKRLTTPRVGHKITLPPLGPHHNRPSTGKEGASLYNIVRSPRPRTSATRGIISLPTILEQVQLDDTKIVGKNSAQTTPSADSTSHETDQTHTSIETELIRATSQDKTDKETDFTLDSWKSDLTRVSSLRWNNSKTPVVSPKDLSLRYKRPEWPHQKPLNQILSQSLELTHLILDRSEIISLRELGSALPRLVTLSVSNCGLTSLDGSHAFPNLRTLILADNKIENASQCAYLDKLQHLDLCANPIDSYEGFVHFILCCNLRSLYLNGTPICKRDDFHTKMKKFIPQIKEIYPSGPRDYLEDDTTDLDAFVQRNKKLIGSSYDPELKSKNAKKKKKGRVEMEIEETYKNPRSQISSESDLQIATPLDMENDVSSDVGAVKTLSKTSLGSISSLENTDEISNEIEKDNSTYEEYFKQTTQYN